MLELINSNILYMRLLIPINRFLSTVNFNVRFRVTRIGRYVHLTLMCMQMLTNATEPTTVTRTRIARTLEAATHVCVKMDTWATESTATVSSR